MSEFGEFFKIKFPNIQATIDQTLSEESILLKKACRIIWDARQAEIDQLKAQLNNMGTCYIEKKKQVEDQQGRVSKALNFINNWWHPDLDQKLFVEAVAKALRGEQPKTKCGNLFCNEPSAELLCPKCKRNIKGES